MWRGEVMSGVRGVWCVGGVGVMSGVSVVCGRGGDDEWSECGVWEG